ncbi:mycofactocin system transcriptional regulator [Baekduia sp.]|uniref:mycofactocin system transcriptional regulator n=1 Tax=Baekduia sp. TaxID=2600305 RepID=UPI0032C219CA
MPQGKPETRGRPPSTTAEEVGKVALRLFEERGFDETTMDDIAKELGVGRRTLFRYYASKNDMVWGNFDWVLGRLRSELSATGARTPLMTALREAVVVSNTYPADALPDLRSRMALITTVPALQAHSVLRYAEWRAVVAEFVARRLRRDVDNLEVGALAYAALAASISAFSHWVAHPEKDLLILLDRSYRMLEAGYDRSALRRLTRDI